MLSGEEIEEIAIALHDGFAVAFREVLKEDFSKDGRAFAGYLIDVLTNIQRDSDHLGLSAAESALIEEKLAALQAGSEAVKLALQELSGQMQPQMSLLCNRFGVIEHNINVLLENSNNFYEKMTSTQEDLNIRQKELELQISENEENTRERYEQTSQSISGIQHSMNALLNNSLPGIIQNIVSRFEASNGGLTLSYNHNFGNPSYNIGISEDSSNFTVGCLSFPNNNAGRNGWQKYIEYLEKGVPLELQFGEFIWSMNLDLSALSMTPLESKGLTSKPIIPQRSEPVSIKIRSEDDSEIYEISFLEVRVSRIGIIEAEYVITSPRISCTIHLIENRQNSIAKLSFSNFDFSKLTLQSISSFIDFLEMIDNGNVKLLILSLRNDMTLVEGNIASDSSIGFDSDWLEMHRLFLGVIGWINDSIGTSIEFPRSLDEVSDREYRIASILKELRSKRTISVDIEGHLTLLYEISDARHFIQQFLEFQKGDFSRNGLVFSFGGSKKPIPKIQFFGFLVEAAQPTQCDLLDVSLDDDSIDRVDQDTGNEQEHVEIILNYSSIVFHFDTDNPLTQCKST